MGGNEVIMKNTARQVNAVEHRTTIPDNFLLESDKWRTGTVYMCESAPDPVFVGGGDERRRNWTWR